MKKTARVAAMCAVAALTLAATLSLLAGIAQALTSLDLEETWEFLPADP